MAEARRNQSLQGMFSEMEGVAVLSTGVASCAGVSVVGPTTTAHPCASSSLPETSSINQPTCSRSLHGDVVELSEEAQKRCQEDLERRQAAESDSQEEQQEQRQVREFQRRDQEVRAHEQAHMAASGRIGVMGPVYTYEQGPDGRLYAVAGEVSFRVPHTDDPREKLELAMQLRRMALAPASPSAKDRAVAAQAAQKAATARIEIIEEGLDEKLDEPSSAGRDETEPTSSLSASLVVGGRLDASGSDVGRS